MKKLMGILLVLVVTLFSCERIDTDILDAETEGPLKGEPSLVVRSGYGFSSTYGNIYVPQGIGIVLKVESTGVELKSASWKIEASYYEGLQVSHKFNSLGEMKISIKAEFKDGSKVEQEFMAISVLDISSADPVKYFVEKNSTKGWDVLFLFSKERLRYADSKDYFYDGLVVDWKKKAVPEGSSYTINSDGKPEKTSDVGKYVGVMLNLSDRGLYNIAFIHSNDNWTDLSGSKFIKSDNSGLAWFWFEDGKIIPQGNILMGEFPGETGDNYFRFTINESSKKVNLFFKLDKEFSTSAFVLQKNDNGQYSDPISMSAVSDHEDWGQIEISSVNQFEKILDFRYGPDKKNLKVFSENMEKSFFYDDFFKSIRLVIYNI